MMAVNARPQTRDEVFNSFAENAQLVIDKLLENGPPREKKHNFSLKEFWSRMETVCKAVSFEATKLAMCFSSPPPPSPEECQSIVSSVEMKSIALVSLYYGLPKECGETLRKRTRNLVINIVEGIKELAERIKIAGYKSSEEQLQSTGAVWGSCDKVQTAAKNNQEAALIEMKLVAGLVKDAVSELDEAKHSDGNCGGGMGGLEMLMPGVQIEPSNHEEVWSERDKAVIYPCLGLATACKGCLKKVTEAVKKNGRHKDMVHVAQLDQIVELCDEISPNLDEMVSCLYAPMHYTVVRANASLIAEVLHKLLAFVKDSHIVTPEDSQWMEFLAKAIDHNVEKVKNVTKDEAPS